MRKVILLKNYTSGDGWQEDGKTEAWFHCFMNEEDEGIVAVLEKEDGTVILYSPLNIKFKNPGEQIQRPIGDNNG